MRARLWLTGVVAAASLAAAGCGGDRPAQDGTAGAAAAERAAQQRQADRRRERAQERRQARIRRQRARLQRIRAEARAERERLREARAAALEREREEAAQLAAAEAQPAQECHPSYDPCLDPAAADYDCAGGSGDGPQYTGAVRVTGADDYDLDADGDGAACES